MGIEKVMNPISRVVRCRIRERIVAIPRFRVILAVLGYALTGSLLLFQPLIAQTQCYQWLGNNNATFMTPTAACQSYNSSGQPYMSPLTETDTYTLGPPASGPPPGGPPGSHSSYRCLEAISFSTDPSLSPYECTVFQCGVYEPPANNGTTTYVVGTSNCGYVVAGTPPNPPSKSDTVGDPINPEDGSVSLTETDVDLTRGGSPIVFQRFYQSDQAGLSDFAPGWSYSYSRSVQLIQTAIVPPRILEPISTVYPDPGSACTSGFPQVQASVAAWVGATATYNGSQCLLTSSSGASLGTLPVYFESTVPVQAGTGTGTMIEYDLLRDDGSVLRFPILNGNPTPPLGSQFRMVVNSSGNIVVTDPNDNVEVYSAVGLLQTITSRAGVVQTLTYDAGGYLASVTDSFGNALNLRRGNSLSSEGLAGVALSGGGTTSYTLDSSDRLSVVTFPDSTTHTFLYQNQSYPNALTGLQDENNNLLTSWSYDSATQANQGSQANGANATSLTFNSAENVSIQDALGTTRVFTFARVGDAELPTGISGSPCPTCTTGAAVSYDANGFVSSRTDYNGNVTCYVNNGSKGQELVRVEGLPASGGCPANLAAYTPTTGQRKVITTWHPTYNLPTSVTEATKTTAFNYDGSGNLLTKVITDTTVTPNVSRTWTYTYNGYGQLLTVDGPRTDVADFTTITYYTCSAGTGAQCADGATCTTGSPCGQVYSITNALGQTTTFTSYDAYGDPLTVTDPNGIVETFTFDGRQRLKSKQVASETTGYAYYPTGLLQTVTRPDGSTFEYTYDGAYRLTQISDGAGNLIQYVPDALGNDTSISAIDSQGTLARSHTRVFNALSELHQDVGSAGSAAVTTTMGYDANENLETIAAPLGRNTSKQYDTLNRLVQITDPIDGVAQFGYDTNNNVTSVIDPRSLQTSYSYNGFGNRTQVTSPDTGTSTATYDLAGNLKVATDARGATATASYDALNRVSSIAYTLNGNSDQNLIFTYDAGTNGIGHLTGASDANHSMAWSYDPLGRVIGKSQTAAGITKSVGYSYTNADLTTLTTPSGQTVTYSYSNHQITGVMVNSTPVLTGVTYDPFGPASGWTWGNGSTEVRLHDEDGNTTLLSGVESVSLGYDYAYRVISSTNSTNSTLSWTFGYDNLDRLTSASEMETSLGWSYDADGNRTQQSGASSSLSLPSQPTFTLNGRGRIVTSTLGSTTTAYLYNAVGERISKVNSTTVLSVYDEAGHLIGEYDATGALIQETVWLGSIPVATLRPQSGGGVIAYYVHADQLGTPRMVSRASDNAVMWRWDSDPFGAAAANQNPQGNGTFVYNLRFPGQYYDAETGTHYNYQRDAYDPRTGRYLESDPIGLYGQSMSTYAYVDGNPISRIDPLGLTWLQDAQMFWAWLSGSAPPNTVYGPLTNQSMDMMQSQGVQNAINYFNQKNAGKCPSQQSPVTNYDYSFGPKALWKAGTNSTQQFVGSYSVNIYPNANGTLDVNVYNTTSMTSFFYGLYPNALNPPNGYPMGNTSQQYVGTVPGSTSSSCGCSGQ